VPTQPKNSRFLASFTAFKEAFLALFGVHEVLFLAGFFGFFRGLSGIWSLNGALMVCGAILMLIAVISILIAQRKGI
jgi:hypothetical protein